MSDATDSTQRDDHSVPRTDNPETDAVPSEMGAANLSGPVDFSGPIERDTEEGVYNAPAEPIAAREVSYSETGQATVTESDSGSALRGEAESVELLVPALEPEPIVVTEGDVAAAVARNTIEPESESRTDLTSGVGNEPLVPVSDPVPVLVPSFFVDRPEPPVVKSNRGVGILIALVGTVAFAVLWVALVALLGIIFAPQADYLATLRTFFTGQITGTVPVVAFFVGMVILIQIVNRGRWWAYILGGLVVAAWVYGITVGSILIDSHYWALNSSERYITLSRAWTNPFAIVAGVLAREVSVWTGAWLAARGRRLKALNAIAQENFERELIESQAQSANAYIHQVP